MRSPSFARPFSTLLVSTVSAAIAFGAVACNKSDAKPDKTKLSGEKTEIPDNFALNPMFAGRDDAPVNLQVRTDGGTPLPSGSGAAAEPSAPVAPPAGLVVTSNGAEPRLLRVYALSGKESRVVTVTSQVSMSGPKANAMEQPVMKMSVSLVEKKDPKSLGSLITGTLTKAEATMAGLDAAKSAQLSQMFGGAAGTTFEVVISPQGTPGEAALHAETAKEPEMAGQIAQVLPQLIEVLTVPFPKEPIGVGATWKEVVAEPGAGARAPRTTKTYTFEKLEKDVLYIKTEVERVTPKQPMPDQKAPPGTTIEGLGKGSYTIRLSPTHVAFHVEGSLDETNTLTVPGKGSQSQSTKVALVVSEK